MIEVFRDLFVVVCLSLLIWGVVRPERIYQYPFFMGVMFVSFILPQAFALINNPYPVSQIALVRGWCVRLLLGRLQGHAKTKGDPLTLLVELLWS